MGIPMLVCRVDGTVGQVEVHSGQEVREGEVLVRIDAPTVQARLHEARRTSEAVGEAFALASRRQDLAYARQCGTLRHREARLQEQVASLETSQARARARLRAQERLGHEGILSPAGVEDAREAQAQAQRTLTSALQSLEQVRQERASLEHQRQENLWARQQTVRNARTQEESLAYIHAQTVVRAPRDGVVEALLVKPGDVVAPGKALGKVVPRGQPLHAVGFLQEKDRAFVKPGDAAVLEMDQLPYAEYGTVKARVVRIGADLASPHEVQEALGEGQVLAQPCFRVELEILDAPAARRAQVPLRSGMMLNARFTLRRQRLITLVLEPLRKWLR
jgi:multidrug resistance efflux pump